MTARVDATARTDRDTTRPLAHRQLGKCSTLTGSRPRVSAPMLAMFPAPYNERPITALWSK
jgi:hypothetical protein